jgi:hypothetical protein
MYRPNRKTLGNTIIGLEIKGRKCCRYLLARDQRCLLVISIFAGMQMVRRGDAQKQQKALVGPFVVSTYDEVFLFHMGFRVGVDAVDGEVGAGEFLFSGQPETDGLGDNPVDDKAAHKGKDYGAQASQEL